MERPRDAARAERGGSSAVVVTRSVDCSGSVDHRAALPRRRDLRARPPHCRTEPVAALTRRQVRAATGDRIARQSPVQQRPVPGVLGRVTQHGTILLGGVGLALAVLVPAVGTNGDQERIAPAATTTATSAPAIVSASSSAAVAFDQLSAASKPADPDDRLHQVFRVQADQIAPSQAPGVLASPLSGPLVKSSGFGHRINPVSGTGDDFHTGQDFAVACGTRVHAAASGTVVFAGWHQFGGGNRVEIDHGNGLVTSYNHNSAVEVRVGQKIKRGDPISLSGTTGNSTGCHLHFEVLVHGEPVDPLGWL